MVYLPSRKAAERLGLHPQTLRRYAAQGRIPFYRNAGGQRLYDVDAFLRGKANPETVCYCRVSSPKQRGDLQRQVAHMRELYPTTKSSLMSPEASTGSARDCSPYWSDFIAEISSLLWLPTGTRLARFGFELIQWLVEQNGGSVLVLNQPDASPGSELTEDLLAVLHSFSCRMHGLRRYRSAIAEDKTLSHDRAEGDSQKLGLTPAGGPATSPLRYSAPESRPIGRT